MRYYLKSKGMYVTELEFSIKEYIKMNQESSQDYFRNVVIQEIRVSSGRSKAIRLSEFDETDSILISELESLGYERESVTDPLSVNPVWDDSECSDIDE